MMQRPITSIVLALLVQILTADAQIQMKVVRLDYVVVREAKNAQGQSVREVIHRTRFVAPDGRERTETADENFSLRMAEIYDPARDLGVRLDPKEKTAIRIRDFKAKSRQRGQLQATFLEGRGEPAGVKLIHGFECKGFRDPSPEQKIEFWFCRDAVSGREFLGAVNFQLADGKSWREDLRRITRDFPVDIQIFEIPPDFRIIDQ